MMKSSKLFCTELDIYSPSIGQPRTDYKQAEMLHREMIEELEKNEDIEAKEDIEEEVNTDDFISSFPPVQYSYTFCDVAFLFHKLNQLAKRKREENKRKKEGCRSPDESMESFCVDFARLSSLHLISAKFMFNLCKNMI